jgi:hypothetical protein
MLVSDSSKTLWCDIGATHVDRQQGRIPVIRYECATFIEDARKRTFGQLIFDQ